MPRKPNRGNEGLDRSFGEPCIIENCPNRSDGGLGKFYGSRVFICNPCYTAAHDYREELNRKSRHLRLQESEVEG